MDFDIEMEEDIHTGGSADLGLNDIEGPDSLLEDSSLEELNNNMEGEGGNSSTSTNLPGKSSSQKSVGGGGPSTRSIHHNHNRHLQVDNSPAPAVPMDVGRFAEVVLSKLKLSKRPRNSPLALSVPTKALDIQQGLIREQEEGLMEHLERYNELKSEMEEELLLKESIKVLATQLEEVKLTNAKLKRDYERNVKRAKEDKESVKKRYDKQLGKKAALEEKLGKMKKEKEKANKKLECALADVKRQDEWFEAVGLSVLISSEEQQTITDSTNANGTSMGTASQIFLALKNIVPNNPEEIFYIQMKTIDLQENKFKANTVHPSFDEAFHVIKEANESQDFVKLLLDCKKYWLRQFVQVGANVSQSSEPEERRAVDADFTKPLFESPTSEGPGGRDN